MRFLSPWALASLGVAAGLLWLTLQWHRPVVGRALTLLLVALALAQPEIARPHGDEVVFLLVDRSISVGEAARESAERLAGQLAGRGARVGIIEFAETAHLVRSPGGGTPASPWPSPWAAQGATADIATALDLALAIAPAAATQLVLLTDGRADRGDELAAAHRARAAGIPISVLPVAQDDHVRAVSLSGPRDVPLGTLELHGQVAASRSTEAEVLWSRDGVVLERHTTLLKPGVHAFTFRDRPDAHGLHRYRIEVLAPDDPVPENNALEWAVHVGEAPEILVVGERTSSVDVLLAGAGVTYRRVEWVNPEHLARVSLVILDDHPLARLGTSVTEALRAHVSAGGGLLVVQGRRAVEGLPGRFEDLLPVSYTVPGRLHEATAALVFVLDRSSSMAARTMGTAHIDLLKEATASAVEAMHGEDVVGAIAFDRQAHWLVHPGLVEDVEAELFRALRGLTPGGGTDIYPGMAEALDALEEIDARLRHVVVLSDGKTLPRLEYPALYERIASSRVGVTAIAVGSGADVEVLGRLAAAAQGELIVLRDFRELRSVFVGEVTRVTRSQLMEGAIQPLPGPAGAAWGLEGTSLPALSGYVLTFPKPTAEVAVISPSGDPLFAAWRFGLGRVAVLNTDLAGGWSEAWLDSSVVRELWGHWLGQLWPIRGPVDLSWDTQGAELVITADVEQGGRWVNGLALIGQLTGASAVESLNFAQVAPGRYRASMPHPGAGAYLVAVWDGLGTYAATTGVSIAYAESLQAFGPDLQRLEPLYSLTGGKLLGDELPPPSLQEARIWIPIWRALLWAAGGAFLADLMLRKLWTSLVRPTG